MLGRCLLKYWVYKTVPFLVYDISHCKLFKASPAKCARNQIRLSGRHPSIYLHIYLVSSGCFPAHLYKRCLHCASTQTSIWNMCTLGIYPCTSILKICILGISLHICIKDVYTGHLPTHIYLKDMHAGYISLYIYLKDVSSEDFPAHLY